MENEQPELTKATASGMFVALYTPHASTAESLSHSYSAAANDLYLNVLAVSGTQHSD